MIYQISKHNYEMARQQYQKVIKVLKGKHKGQNVLLAVEKEDVAVARRDIFDTRKELLASVKQWKEQGYKVTYNLGK